MIKFLFFSFFFLFLFSGLGGTDEGTAAVEAEVRAPTSIVAMKSALMGDVVLAKTGQTKALTKFSP